MSDQSIAIGVDVGKFECVAALHGSPDRHHFCPDRAGIAGFMGFLKRLDHPARIGLEATGGYEARLWEALDAEGLTLPRPGACLRSRAWAAGQD